MNIKLHTNERDLTVVVFAEPILGLRLGEEATLASFDLLSVNRKYENISLGILHTSWYELLHSLLKESQGLPFKSGILSPKAN